MVLLGISLLVASLSFLLYRHPPGFWSAFQRHLGHFTSGAKPIEKSKDATNGIESQSENHNKVREEGKDDGDARSAASSEPLAGVSTSQDSAGNAINQSHNAGNEESASTVGKSSSASPDATPKALAAQPSSSAIPSFSLDSSATNDHSLSSSSDEEDDEPPSFPAKNSAQRAGGSSPSSAITTPTISPSSSSNTSTAAATGGNLTPSRPAPAPAAASKLMPPPPRPQPQSQLQPPRLRAPPPSAAARLRAAPSSSSSSSLSVPPRLSATLSPNTTATGNAQRQSPKKIILKPGHSPLDWAELCRSHARAQAAAAQSHPSVPTFLRVTPSMLKLNNGRHGRPAWTSYYGRVYDVTAYLPFHPGGEKELLRAAGRDGARLFEQVHPWVNWESMLNAWMVGMMVEESDGLAEEQSRKSAWEEMD